MSPEEEEDNECNDSGSKVSFAAGIEHYNSGQMLSSLSPPILITPQLIHWLLPKWRNDAVSHMQAVKRVQASGSVGMQRCDGATGNLWTGHISIDRRQEQGQHQLQQQKQQQQSKQELQQQQQQPLKPDHGKL